MKEVIKLILVFATLSIITGCVSMSNNGKDNNRHLSKSKTNYTLPNGDLLLGNSDYPAISFSGWRTTTRTPENCPTVSQLKEDMKIMSAMGIKLLRTYNTQEFQQTANMLEAIKQLKAKDSKFEMYVMIGAWVGSLGDDHTREDEVNNKLEMDKALEFAKNYPDIVKIIAVGNEASVTWQLHYIPVKIILKWVNYVRDARTQETILSDLLVTSSDNFASWGGDSVYHNDDLVSLVKAVDFVSMHTYPFHDTHYNSDFWKTPAESAGKTNLEKVDDAMQKAIDYAKSQYLLVKKYVHQIDPNKPIHIGETGWATVDNLLYGDEGSAATDEYKFNKYHQALRDWTESQGITCFFFESFDEPWKGDPNNPEGSEKHFGLFTVDGKAKFGLWDLVDKGTFKGLFRDGNAITKSFDGDKTKVMSTVTAPN